MASTQIPNYETRSLANNLKSKNQELFSLFMTHRINAMHALIKFPEYISELWPGHEVGRTDEQTYRINGMHALVKFPEYIPYGLGVMARTRSGTYGRTDRWTDRWTDRRTYGTDRGNT